MTPAARRRGLRQDAVREQRDLMLVARIGEADHMPCRPWPWRFPARCRPGPRRIRAGRCSCPSTHAAARATHRSRRAPRLIAVTTRRAKSRKSERRLVGEERVPLHGEVGRVDLKDEARLGDGAVLLGQRLAQRRDIARHVGIVPVLHRRRDDAGGGRGHEGVGIGAPCARRAGARTARSPRRSRPGRDRRPPRWPWAEPAGSPARATRSPASGIRGSSDTW